MAGTHGIDPWPGHTGSAFRDMVRGSTRGPGTHGVCPRDLGCTRVLIGLVQGFNRVNRIETDFESSFDTVSIG